MRKWPVIAVLFFVMGQMQAQVVPDISARVDTTDADVKSVYKLIRNYLNSNPESLNGNPYFSKKDNDRFSGKFPVDRSIFLFQSIAPFADALTYYKPMILQIEAVETGRYLVKTIYRAQTDDKEYVPHSVPFITRHYAVKQASGVYLLENAMHYDTRNWQRKPYRFINYIVHPECRFDEKEAEKAVAFCEKICSDFGLKPPTFDFYILPDSDALGRLVNFEYWTYYQTGFTNLQMHEIFSAFGSADYPHEFIHMLFPTDTAPNRPIIINEGLATWLGGPGFRLSFEDGLKETALVLGRTENVTLERIMNSEIRNPMDNTILYVTGGMICQMAFEKKGKGGVWTLFNSDAANFRRTLEKVFGKPFVQIEKEIFERISVYGR